MKQRKIPERMCVSCRNMKPKKDLLRVVRAADGTVKIDVTGKASGRGAYICIKNECVAIAEKRRVMEKNLNVADCGALFPELYEMCGGDEK